MERAATRYDSALSRHLGHTIAENGLAAKFLREVPGQRQEKASIELAQAEVRVVSAVSEVGEVSVGK